MDRTTVPSADEVFVAPTLSRPSGTARRLRGRIDRLRPAWRRGLIAAGAGLFAAGLTVAWLSTAPASPIREDRSTSPTDRPATEPEPGVGQPPPTWEGRRGLAEDRRVLALDRSAIVLPVSVGSIVEVIGLRPAVVDVRVEVIAARAEVVGVTDRAILVAVDAAAAYRAAEITAVGQVTVLGRDAPGG